MSVEVDDLGMRRGVVPAPMPTGPASIAALVDGLADSDELALADRNGQLSYRRLRAQVRAAVSRLAELGVAPGAFVAASSSNTAELVVFFLAVQRLGAVWVGLNPALAPREKLAVLNDCAPALVLAEPRAAAELAAYPSEAAQPCAIVSIEDEGARLAAAGATGVELPELPDPLAPAAVAYTSGTTGAPKGVVHSQHSLMCFANGCTSWGEGQWRPKPRRGFSITLTILNAMVYGPLTALTAGGSCALIDRPDAAGVGQWIQDHRIEVFNGAPTTVSDLLYKPELQHLDLGSLKAVAVGGGPTPAHVFSTFRERFGFELVADYGLTESPASVITSGHSAGDPAGAFVHAHPQLQVGILDPDGREVATGEAGELCIGPRDSGPWAGVYTGMLGYWRRPDATRAAFHGRWLRTGDQARRDPAGALQIIGRQSEMILRGGANVFPAEVEDVLRRHEAVADVVVLGLPDERLGQTVAAFVKLETAAPQDNLAGRLAEHCRGELARYKIPERWFLVDDFPRNALSKPIRPLVQKLTDREVT